MTGESAITQAALDNLREIAGGDDSLLAELIDTFFDEAPSLLAEMRQGLQAMQPEALQRAAHSLKSNSADFGAMRLSNLCKELEAMGKAGILEGAAERIAEAAAEYAKVKDALETRRNTL
jgi:HPt (histidine-containing phosphotransfer) domain-containing protein